MTIDLTAKTYLDKVDAWWRAANYISAAQMYLKDNLLLKREVVEKHDEDSQSDAWGNCTWTKLYLRTLADRTINKYDWICSTLKDQVMVDK